MKPTRLTLCTPCAEAIKDMLHLQVASDKPVEAKCNNCRKKRLAYDYIVSDVTIERNGDI